MFLCDKQVHVATCELDCDLLLEQSVELLTDLVVGVALGEMQQRHALAEVARRVADVHSRLLLVASQHPHLHVQQLAPTCTSTPYMHTYLCC